MGWRLILGKWKLGDIPQGRGRRSPSRSKMGLDLAKIAWTMARWNRWSARVWGIGDDGVGCLKLAYEERRRRLGRGSCKIYYWDVISRMVQLQRGKPVNQNFGIKSFYPKIGGHVFTLKFGRRVAGTRKLPRSCHQGINCVQIGTSWFGCKKQK